MRRAVGDGRNEEFSSNDVCNLQSVGRNCDLVDTLDGWQRVDRGSHAILSVKRWTEQQNRGDRELFHGAWNYKPISISQHALTTRSARVNAVLKPALAREAHERDAKWVE